MQYKRNTEWILLLAIWTASTYGATSDWDWYEPKIDHTSVGGFPVRSEMACEDYPIIMRCPGHDVIEITSVLYGRQNSYTCSASSSQTKNTKCILPEAKEIVMEKCNNKSQCTFQVSGRNLRDPCPGTRKYLEVRFNCVRHIFRCPGIIHSIRPPTTSLVGWQPQDGAWTKDPLYNIDHVYFTPFGNTVNEYSSWDDFKDGRILSTYHLPSNMARGNIVVHDRNLFYVKENARSIVRYSLITRTRTRETIILGPKDTANNISLAVDEGGLWIIHSQGKDLLSISKLDKDQLTITKKWTASRRMSDSLHNFVVCGVLYSISSSSGKLDYTFNTNLRRNRESFGLNIDFNAALLHPSSFNRRRPFKKSAQIDSPVSYNPREQMLYQWDQRNGRAIQYVLHFLKKDPAKVSVVTTTQSTTTSTLKPRTTSSARATTTVELTSIREDWPPEAAHPSVDLCPPVTRSNINWPETKVGETAQMPCRDGGGDSATWPCVREPSMREAEWHVAGPDLTKCITWASDIDSKYKSGLIDRTKALEYLASEMLKEGRPITDKSVQVSSDLVKKLLDDQPLPSKEDAERITESVTAISSQVLEREESWEEMTDKQRTTLANAVMTSTEKAGFMYAETLALEPDEARRTEPLIISSKGLIVQIEVRERSLRGMTSSGMTSFPGGKTCFADGGCGSDVIQIPDSEIIGQKGEGPVSIVFSLYNNLGEYLSPNERSEWEVDSRVISATFRHPGYRTTLTKPVVITLERKNPSRSNHRCVFWDYSESSKSGNWSDLGCRLKVSNETHTTCECDHLTSFAVLVNHAGVSMTPEHNAVLDIVTKVGISISIVCLLLCIITFSCFRNLYNDRNTVHKHLCICLLAAETLFLAGIDQTQHEIACSVIAGLLHYFFLAAFLWMALEGFQLYVMLVEVFEGNSRWKWYYLTGYGIPAGIVGISAAVHYSGYGTDEVCWLEIDSGFIWSFVAPVLVIILANLGFLSMTVYKMYVHTLAFTDAGKINSIKASVRGASVLLCLLGITWAFGILWISEEMSVLAYLFCIFNAFQGMFIFVFHCVLPRKVRQEYKRFFQRFPCCQKLGGDSCVANSISFSKQYTPGRFAANGTGGTGVQASLGQSQLQRMWNETVAPRNPDSSPVDSDISANTVQHRDGSRTVGAAGRTVTRHAQSERSHRHEESVLHRSEQQVEDSSLLQDEMDEMQYDRLQHHYHPEDYASYHGPSQPLGRFHTGNPAHRYIPQNHSSTVAYPRKTHHDDRHFIPKSSSHSKMHEVALTRGGCDDGLHEEENPQKWESSPPQRHHYPHRGSLDENFGNGKRDSGIGMQRPHSNNERSNNTTRRSFDNVGDAKPDSDGFDQSGRLINSNRNSFDEAERQRVYKDEGERKGHGHRRSRTMDTDQSLHCPIHSPMVVPLRGNNTNPVPVNNHRRRKSLSSDSDDPIVTDCSVSSAGSSFGNPVSTSNRHPQGVDHVTGSSYYEEPICHKRRLPHPGPAVEHHRRHWHLHEPEIAEPVKDENDLEVEMITTSENRQDLHHPNSGTLGYPPYRPPTPPKSEEERVLATVPAGTRTGIIGKSTYSSSGMALTQHKDVYNQHTTPPDQQYGRKAHRVPNRHEDPALRTVTNI